MNLVAKYIHGIAEAREDYLSPSGTKGFGYDSLTRCKKKGGSFMKEKCINCLWNWENVHTGEGRVCYKNVSPHYHENVGGAACSEFEYRVKERVYR